MKPVAGKRVTDDTSSRQYMKKTIATIVALAATLTMTPGLRAAEDPAPKKGPFAAADANGDGRLDLAEFTQMVSKRMDGATANARFAELDKDGDGSLTRQEARAGGRKGAKSVEETSKGNPQKKKLEGAKKKGSADEARKPADSTN
jgi:hypothetical protein